MTEITATPTREAQIVYITEWAARYGATLQLAGEVGFGRECTGILKGDTYIDYAGIADIWTPEDAYRKHDCMAVLGRGDDALGQLYRWVRWLDEHSYGVEVVYREVTSQLDLLFRGISLPKLVKLP